MRFTASRTSAFGAFVVGIAVVTVFEMPIVHVLLHRAPWWGHALVALANLATLAWLWQARRNVIDAAHTVDDEGVAIDLPGKWRGEIPWRVVASVRRISLVMGAPRPPGVVRVTPLEPPNVELALVAPVRLRGRLGGRAATRVQLFVDEPDRFVEAVRARVPPAGDRPEIQRPKT